MKRARSDPPARANKRSKKPVPDTKHLRLISPASCTYYYECTRLYYMTTDIVYILEHADMQLLSSHLKNLFRAWTCPNLFQQLYRRADDTFVTGFRATEADQKVSDRAHLFVDCENTRTNNGSKGSRAGKWTAWTRYLTYYTGGKYSYRPFKKHPITDVTQVDIHDQFLDPWVKMKGGQGNSSAPKIRTDWTDPDNGKVYEKAFMAFMTEETVDGCINQFVGPSRQLCRPITEDDIQDMRYAYSAGQYWNVSDVYENDVKMTYADGFICEDRHAADDVRGLWEEGGPTMDEWTMTEDGFMALSGDVTDFLYALKIISSHPDKTCLLSPDVRMAWKRTWDKRRLQERAEELFSRVHEPIIRMLRTLKQRI